MAGALTVNLAALGDHMGVFKVMKEGGPMTPAQLADKMELSERFVREWLYQQVRPALTAMAASPPFPQAALPFFY